MWSRLLVNTHQLKCTCSSRNTLVSKNDRCTPNFTALLQCSSSHPAQEILNISKVGSVTVLFSLYIVQGTICCSLSDHKLTTEPPPATSLLLNCHQLVMQRKQILVRISVDTFCVYINVSVVHVLCLRQPLAS